MATETVVVAVHAAAIVALVGFGGVISTETSSVLVAASMAPGS